ncbi:uncharacterized protein LY89DRAFT_410650 [Mollisia scopiformis]|uniref:Uncharacterized protein n=1 Tax=Mollisia scopiformis TaxID=149040 RepID=A0A132B2N8_MOLSC|nr:uncharacterized protein LY89DRAFT_410650 [Mollisia scopiformis]KUJ06513.1 hypothetical protein LY89DRAFT_410650 [Mollisia scopiformis]
MDQESRSKGSKSRSYTENLKSSSRSLRTVLEFATTFVHDSSIRFGTPHQRSMSQIHISDVPPFKHCLEYCRNAVVISASKSQFGWRIEKDWGHSLLCRWVMNVYENIRNEAATLYRTSSRQRLSPSPRHGMYAPTQTTHLNFEEFATMSRTEVNSFVENGMRQRQQ